MENKLKNPSKIWMTLFVNTAMPAGVSTLKDPGSKTCKRGGLSRRLKSGEIADLRNNSIGNYIPNAWDCLKKFHQRLIACLNNKVKNLSFDIRNEWIYQIPEPVVKTNGLNGHNTRRNKMSNFVNTFRRHRSGCLKSPCG